jgi:putative alpha-1,2-mannosidase
MGLYPVTAMGFYVLGSPVFANVTVSVPPGYDMDRTSPLSALQLTVLAHNASAANIYFSSVSVNGVSLGPGAAFVQHAQLWPNGSQIPALLEFWMTDAPSTGAV